DRPLTRALTRKVLIIRQAIKLAYTIASTRCAFDLTTASPDSCTAQVSPVMRILCLHGVGSSGIICESQLHPFIRACDPSYEFIFVDGPAPSDRGPGMGAFLDGPFYSHTNGYDPGSMASAIEHLETIIDESGPFNGVLGFSQGAALALSYMHLQQTRNEPIAFKFALCFSSVIPCSADEDFGEGVIQRLCPLRLNLDGIGSMSVEMQTDEETLFNDLLRRTVIPAQENNSLLPNYDMAVYTRGDFSKAPRLMHPNLTRHKIRVPTVHITGKRDADFMRNMADAARGLCDEKTLKKLEHNGGHQPPQKDAEVKAAIRAMEWAISRSV
ncbi:Uncharacterized protein TCAP_00427, partial [Tolypocladium capitatum]